MYNIRNVTDSIIWVGTNDRRLELFENIFPIPHGVSYNSYVVLDDKTALMDTVDNSAHSQYIENVQKALDGRTLDYLVVNHMEPDHCGTIPDIIALYPEVKVVGNSKTFEYIDSFYDIPKKNTHLVTEGDKLSLGKRNLTFVFAPMVHWPEVMVTYDDYTKALFSADAFGTFGSLNGNLFNDEVDFVGSYEEEARRYFSNIVGRYGAQAAAALKKASKFDILMILPLHGPLWRTNLGYILDKYTKWATYTPEEKGVVIAYTSMYGNTENAIEILGNKLAQLGVKDIKVYDLSKTDASYVISDIWKYSHLVLAAPTYNAGLYPIMASFFCKLEAVAFQNRHVSLIANYSWHSQSLEKMQEALTGFKNIRLGKTVNIKSSVKQANILQLEDMATDIVKDLQ